MITQLTIKITGMKLAYPVILEDGGSMPVIVQIDGNWLSGHFSDNERFYSDTQGIFSISQVNCWFEIPGELV